MSQPSEVQEHICTEYRQHIRSHQFVIQKLKKTKRWVAVARLVCVVAGIGVIWHFWSFPGLVISSLIIFSAILIALVFYDSDLSALIEHSERLIKVNQHEIDIIQFNLKGYDDGKIFSDPNHAFASDMDLFGEFSLFQWLSRCHAEQSKKLLSDRLKYPLSIAEISGNQEAAKELAGKMDTCQQIQSSAMANPLTLETERKLENWIALPSPGFDQSFWKWFQNIYPIIPAGLVIIYGLDIIDAKTILLLLVALNFCQFLNGRKIIAEFGMLLNIEQEMAGLHKQLKLVEGMECKSKKIESLQLRLKPDQYLSASASIKDFNMILKRINWRSNLLINSVLQLFLFWDLRLILLLKQWKKKNEFNISEWIRVIAETEVLISLSSLVHNNPEWSFPRVDDKYFHLTAKGVGHPLISPDKRICNDFKMDGKGTVALITGSNMAGKSTFLRTLGVNIVLAQTGAPVCAQYLELGHMNLISSMRVADNLAENTSTFYAELKKLQGIIEVVNKKEHVLILLDEVLRGTNSADRHRGTQALIRQLLHNTAVTIMATHDTELAQSEALIDPSVYNYHFEGRIIEDELYFDYKIRKGICESFNATTLMKKIGIHFQD
jgi:energy-coupling factor transporter ATP-binding protein EcfA2